MNEREIVIRASCLAADLRAFLGPFINNTLSNFEREQWAKDLEDALDGLEKHLEGK